MKIQHLELGRIIAPAKLRRAGAADYPVLSMTMRDGLVDQSAKFKKRVASADTSPYKVVKRKQLVVGFPIDEGVLAFQDLYDEAIVSPAYDIWDIQDPSVISCDYLQRFLRSPAALSFYSAKLRGTTARRRTLPDDVFLKLPVPLPPLAAQRRIAEVLDKAEALRAKRRAGLAQLDSLTQSLFLDLFGDPVVNPKGWPRGTLGEVATFVGGGTPSRARPEFFEGTICWATSKDMKSEFLDDTQGHITNEAIQQSATNLVPAGTALIVVKSKILAHSLPIAIARVPTCFGQDLKGMTISERADVGFVTAALRCGKRWLLERTRGINTEGLTLDHLRAFPLPLPPHNFTTRIRPACGRRGKAENRPALCFG